VGQAIALTILLGRQLRVPLELPSKSARIVIADFLDDLLDRRAARFE